MLIKYGKLREIKAIILYYIFFSFSVFSDLKYLRVESQKHMSVIITWDIIESFVVAKLLIVLLLLRI